MTFPQLSSLPDVVFFEVLKYITEETCLVCSNNDESNVMQWPPKIKIPAVLRKDHSIETYCLQDNQAKCVFLQNAVSLLQDH